jgi:outer membrane lipoprotein carrier protein
MPLYQVNNKDISLKYKTCLTVKSLLNMLHYARKGLVLVGLALLILSFSVSPLKADKAAMEKALKGLSERYVGLESFSAAYRRTTTTPSTDSVFKTQASQTANGVLQWKQLSKLRLDQREPSQELLMTDGSTVWWYMPQEKQVRIYRDIDLAGELAPLLTFMSGLKTLRDNFRITEAVKGDARKGQTGLILEPKDNPEEGGLIIVYCDKDFALTGFRLSSLTGEKTDFWLTEPKINPALEDKFFVFEIPKNTIVIEESEE